MGRLKLCIFEGVITETPWFYRDTKKPATLKDCRLAPEINNQNLIFSLKPNKESVFINRCKDTTTKKSTPVKNR